MEDSVAVGVLGVRVGALLDQDVVHGLVAETRGPGQGVLPQVGEALVVGVGSRHRALLVLRVEEGPGGTSADVSPGGNNDLGKLIIAISDGQVEGGEAAIFLTLTMFCKLTFCSHVTKENIFLLCAKKAIGQSIAIKVIGLDAL